MRKIILLLFLLNISNAQLETVWVRRFYYPLECIDLTVNNFNNIILTTYPYIRKLNSDGEILWEDSVYLGNWCSGNLCVATDREDNIIVGGDWSNYPYPAYESLWVIFKYNSFGQILWQETLSFPERNRYFLTDITTDNENNIIIVGGTMAIEEFGFWLIFKYSEDGELIWERRYTSNWGPDCAEGVCCDNFNNVIVAGKRGVRPRPRQFYPQVIKYSPNGESLWSHAYIPQQGENRSAGRPAVDNFDNIIMVGGDGVFKYAPDGSKLWSWFTSSVPQPAAHKFTSAITDSLNNIFVIGRVSFNAQEKGFEIWKLTPEGDTIYRFQQPFPGDVYAYRLTLDKEGYLIIAVKNTHDRHAYLFKFKERVGEIEEKEEKVIKEAFSFKRKVYDIKGNLIEDKKLKNGIYFIKEEKKIKKILILR